ncbi:MAG: ATPase, partial [Bacteroidales bacterium]|nr:ATPase [Bacteroidales bacterium]
RDEKKYKTHKIRDARKATYILKEYQKDAAEFEQIDQEIQQRDKRYHELLPWGEYDPTIIEKLQKDGLELLFFTCDKRNFDPTWSEKYDLEIINEEKGTLYFVIAKSVNSEKITIAANEVKMSDISLNRQMEVNDELKLRRAFLRKHFKEMIPYLPTLYEERVRLQNALSFDKTITGTESSVEGTVRITQGFIPEEKEADFLAFLDAQPVYYTALDIEEGESIPVLLKNNSFAKLYEPITKLFALPKYDEMDLTPFMAPFFMLFVGFCAGDAGYGLVLLLGGTIAKWKLNAEFRPLLSLIQWIGVATILFGTLSGSFFGIQLVNVPALHRFQNFFFDQDNMMTLAFVFGGLHLVFAMILNIIGIIRRLGFKFAIHKIGWFVLILSSAAVFGLPMLDVAIPETLMTVYFVVAGLCGLAIFFYNAPGKNPFMNFGLGLWNSYQMLTGLPGDILSYVRLFALGLVGGTLGMVFNQLAFEAGSGIPVVGVIITLLILVFGHALNFAIAMLGAFVHPLRLTFVEFYKNAGYEGGGREYKPFNKVTEEN